MFVDSFAIGLSIEIVTDQVNRLDSSDLDHIDVRNSTNLLTLNPYKARQ
jgi:hypothetical protein